MVTILQPLVPRSPEPPDVLGRVCDTAGDSLAGAEDQGGDSLHLQITHGETEAHSGWDGSVVD